MRYVVAAAAALSVAYVLFLVGAFVVMQRPPEQFAAIIARMPPLLYPVLPFETLWTMARAGRLKPGSVAPNFSLETLDRQARVTLSSFRGAKPVVLVFGSYT